MGGVLPQRAVAVASCWPPLAALPAAQPFNLKACMHKPARPVWHLLAATALLAVGGLATAAPLTAFQLNVYRDGAPVNWLAGESRLLGDAFDNGDPLIGPNFPNGQASTYSLQGLAAGADVALALQEQGGALLLDATYGAVSANALGQTGRSLRLRLNTNVVDANGGLPRSRSFAAALNLSLAALPAQGSSYGMRFSDGFSDSSDFIEIAVIGSGGGNIINFRKQNFVSGMITPLGSAPLLAPDGAVGLLLTLSHSVADTDTIYGSYGYAAPGGVRIGDLVTFATPTTAFQGELHTRIELRATAPLPVPEPAAWLLMAGGLAGLVLRGRAAGRGEPV